MYDETSRRLVSLLELLPGDRVLDLACGTGATTRALLAREPSLVVTGVDVSPAQLEHARRALPASVELIACSAGALAEAVAGPFDRVVCNSAFWQLPTVEALRELARVTRSGAQVAFNVAARMLPDLERLHFDGTPAPPTFPAVLRRIAERDLGWTSSPVPPAGPPFHERLARGLAEVPFVLARARGASFDVSAEQTIAWHRVPVFRENVLPGLDRSRGLEVVERAAREWEPTAGAARWLELLLERT